MNVRVDEEDDALYIELGGAEVIESEEVEPGVILDFDEDGRLVGIEILALSSRFDSKKLGL